MLKLISRTYEWYSNLSYRLKDSIYTSVLLVGLISSLFTILGISLGSETQMSLWSRLGLLFLIFIVICLVVYFLIGQIYNTSISFTIRGMHVSIRYGNIFDAPGLKVIGCDTHFYTQVDDIVISKKSLHGQLILEHGNKVEIDNAVKAEAKKRKLKKNNKGLYDFPFGTIICYDSTVDNNTYLMLALTELDNENRAYTDSVNFESTLIKMWQEIDRVYASNDIVLPLLGTGITRFRDQQKNREAILRCMLCTLNNSRITLNARIQILIYSDVRDISLYEYKRIFSTISYGRT